MANLLSFFILLLFFYGRSLRFSNLSRHIQVMALAMAADYALVLALVINRDALGKVDMDMHWSLKVHVPIAIATVVLYALTAQAGYQLWKGKTEARVRLRRLDRLLVIARVLNLVTSVMVQVLRPA